MNNSGENEWNIYNIIRTIIIPNWGLSLITDIEDKAEFMDIVSRGYIHIRCSDDHIFIIYQDYNDKNINLHVSKKGDFHKSITGVDETTIVLISPNQVALNVLKPIQTNTFKNIDLDGRQIWNLSYTHILLTPTLNENVPYHEIMSDDEIENLNNFYSGAVYQYILLSDPIVFQLNAKIGDIIKIRRLSHIQGEMEIYRQVIEPHPTILPQYN